MYTTLLLSWKPIATPESNALPPTEASSPSASTSDSWIDPDPGVEVSAAEKGIPESVRLPERASSELKRRTDGVWEPAGRGGRVLEWDAAEFAVACTDFSLAISGFIGVKLFGIRVPEHGKCEPYICERLEN